MDSEITCEFVEKQFKDIRTKLSNLKLLVEDYPVLHKPYEESEYSQLTDRIEGLYKTFTELNEVAVEKSNAEESESQTKYITTISNTLSGLTLELENSDIVKQAGLEYLKDYDIYNCETQENSEEMEKELQNLDKIKKDQDAKIKSLKYEINKLNVSNEELEAEIDKLQAETSEEQREFELAKQRKEIEDLQNEIQNMELKIREGQEQLENLNRASKEATEDN